MLERLASRPSVVLSGARLPARLADLSPPPARLYVHGVLPRGPAVAIVGTRTPTVGGERFAHALARELARLGVAVLSGGAVGIDSAAHRGALAGGGATVVVAPCGFSAPFPPENAALFRRIVERGGAYVSEVADGIVATRAAFFSRNGCLAALAHVVVIVQAGYRSGARNATAQARRLGRPVLAVPSSPWMPRGQGCVADIRLGAAPCEGPRDVLRALGALGLCPVKPPKARRSPKQALLPGFSEAEASEEDVLAALGGGASHPDALAVQLGCSPGRLQRALLTLELRGVLVRGPDGSYGVLSS